MLSLDTMSVASKIQVLLQVSHSHRLVNLKVKQKQLNRKNKVSFSKEKAKTSPEKHVDNFPQNKALQALQSAQFLFSSQN